MSRNSLKHFIGMAHTIKTQSQRVRPLLLFLTLFAALGSFAAAQNKAKPEAPSQGDIHDVIQPGDLAKALKGTPKPIVLYVGPQSIYAQAHIPGAENIGPTGKPEGLEKLRNRVASLPKNTPLVIYCGCCPWEHCPNIRPAYAELKKAGFTSVRALRLDNSFGTDWKDKGLPTASGE